MASGTNSYEEARKKRLQENLQKIEGLGITAIKESLSEIAKCKTKKYATSPPSRKSIAVTELRRSSRARNLVSSYREDESADVERYLRSYNRRGWNKRSYTGAVASYEERIQAIKRAERFQTELKFEYPYFIKPMVRSHVSSCFWLGLPSSFCKDYLPNVDGEVKMILEDEDGAEYEVVYICKRVGLSGGWRGYAIDHGLDDGDALLFELVQPDKFKVYIFKAAGHLQQDDEKLSDEEQHPEAPEDELKYEDDTDQQAVHSKKSHKKPKEKKANNPNPIDAKSKQIERHRSATVNKKSQSRKTIPKQDDDNYEDEKPPDLEPTMTRSSRNIVKKDATDVQEPRSKRVQSRGRVKRPPKCSRI